MLTHYFELRAIPQIEITEVEVMSQIVQTLHLTLVNYDGEIGICFPAYTARQRKTLGGIVRLFGDESTLDALRSSLKRQSTIADYAIMLELNAVPANVTGYLQVHRVHEKGQSALRRAQKRLTEQGKWSAEVEQNMLNKWGQQQLNYPHLHLKSSSTGQKFTLWVKQRLCEKETKGKFNSYGMSQTTTVPNF